MSNKWVLFLFCAVVLLLVLAGLSLGGCAPGLDGARQALSAAERVQTQAIYEVEKYDEEHQADIVTAAPTLEEGQKALMAYRTKRGQVVKVILDAAAVTAVGRTLIPLVERGVKKSADLDGWLSDLLAAGLKIKDALASFTSADFVSGPQQVKP